MEKNGKFINLKRGSESIGMAMPEKELEPRGPSFYVHDIELPLDSKDTKELEAMVKLKPSVTITEREGKKRYSYDFEVTAIKFS